MTRVKLREIPKTSEHGSRGGVFVDNLHIPDSAAQVCIDTEMIDVLNQIVGRAGHVLGEYDGPQQKTLSDFSIDSMLRPTRMREWLSKPPISRDRTTIGFDMRESGLLSLSPAFYPIIITELNRQYAIRAATNRRDARGISMGESWRSIYEKVLADAYVGQAAWRLTGMRVVQEIDPISQELELTEASIEVGRKSWRDTTMTRSAIRRVLQSGDLVTLDDF